MNYLKSISNSKKRVESNPEQLLPGIPMTILDLAKIKNLSDEEFFNYLISYNREYGNPIDMSYFNRIDYNGDVLTIVVPPYNFERFDTLSDSPSVNIKIRNNGKGITNGQIIRTIADNIPTKEELKERYIKYITNHPEEVYDDIEDERNDYYGDEIDEKYPKDIMDQLINYPAGLAEYMFEREDRFTSNRGKEYGGRIFFGGLTNINGVYNLYLGS